MERNDPNLQHVGGGEILSQPRVRPAAEADHEPAQLMTPGEVARLFGVDPKTVSRWADAGKIQALRTLGGHRRYHADEVYGLLGG